MRIFVIDIFNMYAMFMGIIMFDYYPNGRKKVLLVTININGMADIKNSLSLFYWFKMQICTIFIHTEIDSTFYGTKIISI